MNQNPVNAYTNMQKESLSGRELEASVLSRAGIMLKQVQENWNASDRGQRLVEAIKFSQRSGVSFRLSYPIRKTRFPKNFGKTSSI